MLVIEALSDVFMREALFWMFPRQRQYQWYVSDRGTIGCVYERSTILDVSVTEAVSVVC